MSTDKTEGKLDRHSERAASSERVADPRDLIASSGLVPSGSINTDATLDNSVQVPAVGIGGFDSRLGGKRLLLAVAAGYVVVDRGMETPVQRLKDDAKILLRVGSRANFAKHESRPARIIELKAKKGE